MALSISKKQDEKVKRENQNGTLYTKNDRKTFRGDNSGVKSNKYRMDKLLLNE